MLFDNVAIGTSNRSGGDGAGHRGRRLLAAAVVAASALPFLSGPTSAADFSNPAPISVPLPGPPPGCPSTCPSEKASPYPSAIAVSGVAGTVADVNVTLRNLTYEHNGLADVDILLVAPGGKSVMVMSDNCGSNSNAFPVANPITLTLDDQAGSAIPADGACSTGTFRPLDDDNDGEFPFHVPDGFTDGPSAPASSRPLADFNGIDPNGTWSLYVVDDYPNDPDPAGKAGEIAGGWTIDIDTTAAAPDPTSPPPPATAPGPAPASSPGTVATTRPGSVPVAAPAPATTAATVPPAPGSVPSLETTTTIPTSSSTVLDDLSDLLEKPTSAASRPNDDKKLGPGPLVIAAGLVMATVLILGRLALQKRATRRHFRR